MRSYKPRHDTLWGYPRETQRLRPGTRHAHPRILKRCTGLALRLSGNAHTHHSSFVASRITHHLFVASLPSLPHARLLCSSARPAVVAGRRRCGAWRVVAAAARSARSPPAALLTASRVPVRRPLRRCRHPSHVRGRTTGRAFDTTRRRGLRRARVVVVVVVVVVDVS